GSSLPSFSLRSNSRRKPCQSACLPLSRYSLALRIACSRDSIRSTTAFNFAFIVSPATPLRDNNNVRRLRQSTAPDSLPGALVDDESRLRAIRRLELRRPFLSVLVEADLQSVTVNLVDARRDRPLPEALGDRPIERLR